MNKKKISPFEYAIMQLVAEDNKEVAKDLENVEPYTKKEVMKQREDNIRNQFDKLRFKGK